MALLRTFGEIQNSRVLQVAASCSNSDEFRSLVNEATDILMQRGDWPGTIIPARFIVRNGCVVWPRQVQRVRRINHCNVPLTVKTVWWDFVDKENYAGWSGAGYYNWGGNEITGSTFNRAVQGSLTAQGRVCVYNDVPTDTPRYVRAYPLSPNDVGQTVTIFGIDGNGQPLQTLNTAGTYSPGAIITLSVPFGSTATYVQRIDSVQKSITQMNVPIYAYDPISNTMLDLAIYEPNETNPSYAKDRLFSANHRFCSCDMTVVALVKLAFIPVFAPTDYVLIPSTNALKKAVQSIKYGESGDIENQEAFLQSAVNELNMVMGNEEPLNETVVDTGFMGEKFALGHQSVI